MCRDEQACVTTYLSGQLKDCCLLVVSPSDGNCWKDWRGASMGWVE